MRLQGIETKGKGASRRQGIVMFAYLEIIRPLNCLMAIFAVYIATLVAGLSIYPSFLVLLGMLATFLVCAGGMVINDYFDAQIDSINKPNRPIPSGKIKKNIALGYSIVLFVAGITLSYAINYYTLATAIAASLVLILYAWRLKNTVLVGNMMISLLVALTFIFGGFIAMNYLPVLILAVLAFLANTGREIYKCVEDILGDKQAGTNTIAAAYGIVKSRQIATLFIIVAIILSFLPFFFGIFGVIYLFFVVIADIIFMVAVISPVKIAAKVTKFAMLTALIAFLIGAL